MHQCNHDVYFLKEIMNPSGPTLQVQQFLLYTLKQSLGPHESPLKIPTFVSTFEVAIEPSCGKGKRWQKYFMMNKQIRSAIFCIFLQDIYLYTHIFKQRRPQIKDNNKDTVKNHRKLLWRMLRHQIWHLAIERKMFPQKMRLTNENKSDTYL